MIPVGKAPSDVLSDDKQQQRQQSAKQMLNNMTNSKVELHNKLSTGLYREVLDSPTGRFIQPLIKAVCLAFTDLQGLT